MSGDELASWMAAAGAPEGGVEAHEMLARLRRDMFARDTAPRVGRYEALEEIGRGGMGVVYRARDPQLKRNVAVKVLRTGRARTRARLRREARAMARLSHPNVVKVLEVGATDDGELFVVMEYVKGTNGAQWLAADARTPAEIMEVFLAAGEGLAAAHAQGIVHRDFKPSNVLVAEDGRVLVGDFGLAREAEEPRAPDSEHRPAARASAADGEGGGPPVRASVADSEGGRRLGRASVAESGGGRPPARASVVEPGGACSPARTSGAGPEGGRSLVDAGVAGFVRPLSVEHDTRTGARVGTPRYMAPEQRERSRVDARADQWALAFSIREALPDAPGLSIDRVLDRALNVDVAARYPDVPAFLAALRAAARPRRRGMLVGAGLVLAAVATIGLAQRGEACEPATRLAEVWTPVRRAGIAPAFEATDVSYAARAADNTTGVLDAYAEHWSSAYADACEADDETAQVCLTALLTELDATLDAFESADAKLVGGAERAARGLTPPRRCVDAPAPASVDPEALTEYARLLGRVQALTRAGRWDEARDDAMVLVERAAALGDPYAQSEAAFHLGMNRKRTGKYEAAAASLTSAYYTAAEAELAERAAKAALGQLQLTQRRADYVAAEQWIRHAQTWIARVPDNKEMRIELLISRADLDGDRSRHDEALQRLDEAWELCERDTDSPHAGRILNLMAFVYIDRGDYDEAERLLLQSERVDSAHLGPGHPNLSHVHNNLGTVHYHRREYAEASESWERAYDIAVAASGEGSIHTGVLLMNLGIAADELGDLDGALKRYAEAESVFAARVGRDHPRVAHVVQNRASTLSRAGRNDEALQAYREALRIYTAVHGEDHGSVGEAHFKVGNVLSDLRRLDEGLEHYERSREIIARHQGTAHPLYGVLLHNIGIALLKAGDAGTALRMHRAALAIVQATYGPSHAETAAVLLGITESRLALGQYAETIVAAELTRAAGPSDPLKRGLVAFDLAQARHARGRDRDTIPGLIAEARQFFAAAGRRARDNPAILQEWIDRTQKN